MLSLIENIVKGFKNPPISKEIAIITVPGNHDCNFTKVEPKRSELLEKIKFIPSEDIDINTVDQCASVQADYFDFAARIGNKWDKQKLGYVMTIKLADYQLTFNCYNTAWMYTLDQLPASCIFPVNSANRHINSTISNLNISLLHHPLEWFNPDNRRIFKKYLTRISDLVLTGHEHQMGKRIEDNLEGKIPYTSKVENYRTKKTSIILDSFP